MKCSCTNIIRIFANLLNLIKHEFELCINLDFTQALPDKTKLSKITFTYLVFLMITFKLKDAVDHFFLQTFVYGLKRNFTLFITVIHGNFTTFSKNIEFHSISVSLATQKLLTKMGLKIKASTYM